MHQFRHSCMNASSYPVNLLAPNAFPYELELYRERLLSPTSLRGLCYEEKNSRIQDWGIHMWEKQNFGTEYTTSIASTTEELQQYFRTSGNVYKYDPLSRFTFLHARNARDRLNVTMPMLQQLLSHHQVSPCVIDQLLSYGRRKSEQDFSSRLFYSETNMPRAMPLPDLARSGNYFQLGYTLRSIEDPQSWSMRQASLYHCFDTSTGRAFWLIVKASTNIRQRLQQVTRASETSNDHTINSPARCLALTLSSHLVMCSWANENWRPYLQELESDVHSLTKPAVVYEHKSYLQTYSHSRSNTLDSMANTMPAPSRRSTLQRASTFIARPFSRISTHRASNQPVLNQQTVAEETVMDDLENETHDEAEDDKQFSVVEMQRIQAIEEKLNSTLLVLRSNSDALSQLRDFYSSISIRYLNGQSCFKKDVEHFSCIVGNILSDLKMQASRLETLQKLLSDRKILFNAIIEHRNAEANKELARRAQKSQDNMEKMTNQMSDIAEKTQQETVSMRIITLVTLFFLPGTFISTLMSTSIIQFDPDEHGGFKKLYSSEALRFFFKVSAPLMIVTFIAWYGIYLWVNHRQRIRKMKFMQRWQQVHPSDRKSSDAAELQDSDNIA